MKKGVDKKLQEGLVLSECG